jgi:ribonuclease P protein component
MLPKKSKFTRASFPRTRPHKKHNFFWGSVSFFDTAPGVAVVVSKKAIKKAHERNHAKRRVYALFHHSTPPCGTVVHLRSEARTTDLKTIQRDIESAMK